MKNRWFCTSQATIFQSKSHRIFKLFPSPLPGHHFSDFWCFLAPQSSILGYPRRPAVSKMVPKITQAATTWWQNAPPDAPMVLQNTVPGTDLIPKSLSERSWASFWSIWDGCLKNFEWFWHQFGSISDNFGDNFADHWSRMPRIEKPTTIKNKQITAETARTSRELQITTLICFLFADFEYNLRLAWKLKT